jgi:hypothetical protein
MFVLHGNVDSIILHDRALTPQEVAFLANRGNVNAPDYVVRFAPELRFTQDSASQGYPMSAQPFFDRLTKDSNGYPIAMPGDSPLGVENTDISTLRGSSIPTYYMLRITSPPARCREALRGHPGPHQLLVVLRLSASVHPDHWGRIQGQS